ncbi:MLO-like protein 14 isoform X4 [Beta vulgaris subsp. vulgaris]|uniref:MLO-like protein 14 isoform X4 n=1 Tax=Beta vulgaris subsp. vulgaris TaxID=3555 RepID=UPI00203733B8|nr:MLO-like protein 14 isoform X4 [Beta vulgaris subsp. vulgaris]
MEDKTEEMRSLALTPTWSVASVLTFFVAVSLLVERSIHWLSNWLDKTRRKPLLQTVEKMKEELMLLGFISLLLTATSSTISNICISSKFFGGVFSPCSEAEVHEATENESSEGRKLWTSTPHTFRKLMSSLHQNKCPEGKEPFVSYEGLEQLHRFIFIMAVTHVTYSCLTMLLAIVKVHSWRKWEDQAHMDRHDALTEITRELVMRRQSSFVKFQASNSLTTSKFWIWVPCFFRQFGHSVVRADYLTLRKGFIMNHNLTRKYDFHSYMIRSMEEEFQRIVGVRIKSIFLDSDLTYSRTKLKPRDDLFWFKKPQLLLSLIHFVLFQWQFGYDSCFIKNHLLVYLRLILGFSGQFLCSYSTLPLYALVTQMGTNYKAALIPHRIRETIHGWKKSAAKRKKRLGVFGDDSTIHTDASTVMSLDDDDNHLLDIPESGPVGQSEIELQSLSAADASPPVTNETSSRVGTPLLRPSASTSSRSPSSLFIEAPRSFSMPSRRD